LVRSYYNIIVNYIFNTYSLFQVRIAKGSITVFIIFAFCQPINANAALNTFRSFEMGMAFWVPQTKESKEYEVKKSLKLMLDNSDHILLQIPWSPIMKFPLRNAEWMGALSKTHKRPLTIALDWMDEDRKSLLDADIKRWSFGESDVKNKFLSDVSYLASQYEPQFILLGVEVDFLAIQDPQEFRNFVSLYSDAYKIIRIQSPKTLISVSFQFENLLDIKDPELLITQTPIVKSFGPLLDTLGLSVYPCQRFLHANEIPADYISSEIPKGVGFAIFETGWPAQGKDELLQRHYVNWILNATSSLSVNLVVWISAVDTDSGDSYKFNQRSPICMSRVSLWKKHLGLWTILGGEKAGKESWKFWFKKPLVVSAN
jgi:hypothetical protein